MNYHNVIIEALPSSNCVYCCILVLDLLSRNWGEVWGFMSDGNAVVFVDNHDNQRGHGAGGSSIITFWDSRLYKMAVGYMLAHPYGLPRIMSSYRWNRHFVNGKVKSPTMGNIKCFHKSVFHLFFNTNRIRMTGWALQATLMDPLCLFLLTQTRLV